MNGPAEYNLSFTAASLRPEFARIMAERYLDSGDWEVARVEVLRANALQAQRLKSSMRMELEFRNRLQTLSRSQLELLANGSSDEVDIIALLAVMKFGPFVFEFCSEVLRDKLQGGEPVIRRSDYDAYFESKTVLHPELLELKDTTRVKLRQVTLKLLRDAGMLTSTPGYGTVSRPTLSPAVRDAIRNDDTRWLAGFLLTDREIARL